ncbi:hypothetical protein SAMN02745857_04000 [Andreprevotia lacus DSM 23236]|uniref:Uncharacterized protein n=2 Tax=Andreprevotia TaxID=397275 RepID=A0A1W1Y0K9_9NEIS|nr:hypothetical protein SAMN02745857_04000 [Andreprevotia lacus DSM 23236]
MAGYADFSDLGKLLKTYQYVFEKARYHYELYENYTLDEQHELEVLWLQIGAPPKEAVVQYHPYELLGLIAGLSSFIEACLRKLACAAN